MHNVLIELMQLGASLPREKVLKIVEMALLSDRITDVLMAEAVRQIADQGFTEARDRLSDVNFVILIVDAGTFSHLESIPCLLTNPHPSEQPVLPALRENRNFTI
jgi:hypothetical protein